MYLHKLSSGFQQRPDFALTLLKKLADKNLSMETNPGVIHTVTCPGKECAEGTEVLKSQSNGRDEEGAVFGTWTWREGSTHLQEWHSTQVSLWPQLLMWDKLKFCPLGWESGASLGRF